MSTPIAHGHQLIPISCDWCGAVSQRRQNAGADAPRYCDQRCARAAKRRRRRIGMPGPVTVPKIPTACPGCGVTSRLKSRTGFMVCEDCRARLHGACMRKIAYGGFEAALALGARLVQHPYRCAYCAHWHLTSENTAEDMPGDAERGARMRQAGFSRRDVDQQQRARSPC